MREPAGGLRERPRPGRPVGRPVNSYPDVSRAQRDLLLVDEPRVVGVALDGLAVAEVDPGVRLHRVRRLLTVPEAEVEEDLAARGGPGRFNEDLCRFGPVADGDHPAGLDRLPETG